MSISFQQQHFGLKKIGVKKLGGRKLQFSDIDIAANF